MRYAGAGTHYLNIAGFGAAFIAHAVLMGNRPLADIGDDFHVAMRVRVKPLPRRDFIIIPNAQPPPIHALSIAVMPEGEMMIGIEPTEIGLAQAFKGTEFDHGFSLVAA